MAAACLGLVAGAVLKSQHLPFFWYDELATASLVGDRSLTHMIAAVAAGAENNPPLYPAFLWLWARVAGAGELSLRLPSAIAMSGAVVVVWTVARRAFRTREVAAGVLVGLLTAPTVVEQAFQARFYGFFLLWCAVALAFTVAAMTTERRGAGLAIALAIAHSLLLYTHTFGILFSGALLVSLLVSDISARRLRLGPYLGIAGAWALYLAWVPVVVRQAGAVAAPNSWLLRPTRDDLLNLLTGQTRFLPVVAVAVVVGAWIERAARVTSADDAASVSRRAHAVALMLAGPALIAVVPLVFVISRLATPIFLDRYLLPAALGWVIVVACLAAVPRGGAIDDRRGRIVGLLWGFLFAVGAAYPVAQASAIPSAARPSLALDQELSGLPVVVESGHQFWPLRHYAADRDRVHFLLDWPTASDQAAPPGAAQQYRLMELYAREGYLGKSVEPAESFLCTSSRFILVNEPGFLLFERRIAADPGFRSRPIGRYDTAVVRLVEGRSSRCAGRSPAGS